MTPGQPSKAGPPWSLLLLLAAAGLFRIACVIPPFTDWDENWVGVAAVNVLKGTFPYFFYGQPYMGSLESFLHAVVIAVGGPSRWSLKILPVVFGVLFVYLSYLLALRLFDRRTAWLAALAAAFPSPVLLGWTLNARLHYGLTPLLGVLLFFVFLKLVRRREPSTAHLFVLLGFLSGLIWWTNYIGVIYLVPVGGILLGSSLRRSLSEGLRYSLPAFFVGSLPFWAYNLPIGAFFLSPRGTWATHEAFLPQLEGFFTRNLPSLLGVPVPPDLTIEWTVRTLMVGVPLLVGLTATVVRWVRGEWEQAVLPLVTLSMGLLVGVSVYGEGLPDRYIFPLFAVIPLILGAGFSALHRWSTIGAWGLAGLLAAANIWTSLGQFSWVSSPNRLEHFRRIEAGETELFHALKQLGLRRNYAEGDELNFRSGGTLVFSAGTEDPHPAFAQLVDGSGSPGYVSKGPAAGLEAGLAALGASYEVERRTSWWIYHQFQLPQTRYRELSPHGWSATAEENPQLVMSAFDRDIETLWASSGGQKPGSTYLLDLNRVETVGMVAWIPRTFRDTPRGLEVATSLDAQRWHPVVRVPNYDVPVYWSGTHPFFRLRRPRVEVRFPATPTRFLKLTQLGEDSMYDWSIRELFVFSPVESAHPSDPMGIDKVAKVFHGKGLSKIYGDHWVLARLKLASNGALPVLPVNIYIDSHGRTDLYWGWKHPPNYEKLDRLQLSETVAVVLEAWAGTSEAFEQILREAGYTFDKEGRGDYLIYSGFTPPPLPTGTPLPKTDWRVWASVGGETAQLAVDGDPGSRWTTGWAQHPGMWFAVDLGHVAAIDTIELHFGWSNNDHPRDLRVALSEDGESWRTLAPMMIRSGRLYWGGGHALRRGLDRMILRFPPTTARYVKLLQTGKDPFYFWSIHELQIYPAGEATSATPARAGAGERS